MTPPADLPAAGTDTGDAAAARAPSRVPPVDAESPDAVAVGSSSSSGADGVPAAQPSLAPLDLPLPPVQTAARKRPKPGERRVQILQALGSMLGQPGAERVTTAALAARLAVSEAALYRHFASKAQMFEALVDFIEQSVLAAVEPIASAEPDPRRQVLGVLTALLQFAEHNPGMARVMVGDALVLESERLAVRMSAFFDRIEAHLRRSLEAGLDARVPAGSAGASGDPAVQASALTAFAIGRLQRFARSGDRSPTEHLDTALRLFVV